MHQRTANKCVKVLAFPLSRSLSLHRPPLHPIYLCSLTSLYSITCDATPLPHTIILSGFPFVIPLQLNSHFVSSTPTPPAARIVVTSESVSQSALFSTLYIVQCICARGSFRRDTKATWHAISIRPRPSTKLSSPGLCTWYKFMLVLLLLLMFVLLRGSLSRNVMQSNWVESVEGDTVHRTLRIFVVAPETVPNDFQRPPTQFNVLYTHEHMLLQLGMKKFIWETVLYEK